MKNTILSLMLLGIITGTVFAGCTPAEDTNTPPVVEEETGSETTTEEGEEGEEEAEYEDGTYTADAPYQSPAGPENMVVKITVEGGAVAAVEITPQAVNPGSVNFQKLFSEGIGEMVIGKNLDELSVFAQVNGSSLAPKGFQVALDDVKAQASS